jgi:hypothetical protein
MSRGLSRSVLIVSVAALVAATAQAEHRPTTAPAILQRFFDLDAPSPTECRALRHLEARNEKFEKSAWMDVWTEADPSGFRYRIVAEEGSEYIRSKVFRASLDAERKMWAAGTGDQSALTPANYVFEDRGGQPGGDGLTSMTVTPRRQDVTLVNGTIFLNPENGELVRIEGRLAKSPSFWTRHVKIVRWYRRIAGFQMPTALESEANVRIAGISTFRMSYDYESINGQHIGNPQPKMLARASTAPQP